MRIINEFARFDKLPAGERRPAKTALFVMGIFCLGANIIYPLNYLAGMFPSGIASILNHALATLLFVSMLLLIRYGRVRVAVHLAIAAIGAIVVINNIESGLGINAPIGPYFIALLFVSILYRGRAREVMWASVFMGGVLTVFFVLQLVRPDEFTPGGEVVPALIYFTQIATLIIFAVVLTYGVRLLERDIKQIEGLKIQNDFLANVSHELRSPLNAIIGYSEVLMYHLPHTDGMHQDASAIYQSGHRLLGMIESLLDMSKIQIDPQQARRETVDVAVVCDKARELVDGLLLRYGRAEDITFVCEANCDMLVADGTMVRQILYNLLANAVKFTRSHVSLSIDEKADCWLLAVGDDGPGVRPDQQERIFGRFHQGTSVAQVAGTGLGLAIAQELAKAMNGRVYVNSRPQIRTTFTLYLPKVS